MNCIVWLILLWLIHRISRQCQLSLFPGNRHIYMLTCLSRVQTNNYSNSEILKACQRAPYDSYTQKGILNMPCYVITAISSTIRTGLNLPPSFPWKKKHIPSPFHPTPLSLPTQNTRKIILSQRQINVGLPTSKTPKNKEETWNIPQKNAAYKIQPQHHILYHWNKFLW